MFHSPGGGNNGTTGISVILTSHSPPLERKNHMTSAADDTVFLNPAATKSTSLTTSTSTHNLVPLTHSIEEPSPRFHRRCK